ncbi:MAG TPA: hypothetical protein VHU92_26465 [Streptosporangiaceae bacterium]|nr:hypothetical protein [Streptosporangiaceae bacterium]
MEGNHRLAAASSRPTPAKILSPARLIVHDSRGSGQLVGRSLGGLGRTLARARALGLDRDLAAGRPPEASRMLAARAQDLVAPRTRQTLAGDWEHLLRVARRPVRTRSPLAAICRARVTAAEPDILEMVTRLRAPLPVAARGVATASTLLGDGAGPLYNKGSRRDLAADVRRATRQLDPSASLFPAEP